VVRKEVTRLRYHMQNNVNPTVDFSFLRREIDRAARVYESVHVNGARPMMAIG
jgi:hypothetical protein